jgi:hypothetical protein
VLLVTTNVARADDPMSLREGLLRGEPLLEVDRALIDIDTAMRSNTQGFEADVTREQYDFKLGTNTRARIESSAWENPLLNGNGWGASLRIVHDFKVIQIGVEAGFQRVDSGAVDGPTEQSPHSKSVHRSYAFVGAAITKKKKLSKWMTAWISLSVGRRKWINRDQPPPNGEADDTAGMLSIGTTFR